jgi:hypothetical protein
MDDPHLLLALPRHERGHAPASCCAPPVGRTGAASPCGPAAALDAPLSPEVAPGQERARAPASCCAAPVARTGAASHCGPAATRDAPRSPEVAPGRGRVPAQAPAACCAHPVERTAAPPHCGPTAPLAPRPAPRGIWARAAQNTLICLAGCTIGDVGVVVASWIYAPHAPMLAIMLIAIVAGLITSLGMESFWLMRRGSTLRQAISTALSMSFVSMVAMETAMNIVDLGLTGGNRIHLGLARYLGILAIGALAGFLVPWPYNAWRLRRGRSCH